jgi:hypothetical protein
MSTSGTTTFNLSIDDLVEEAFTAGYIAGYDASNKMWKKKGKKVSK